MIAIFILLLLSWAVLRFRGENLTALGLLPGKLRLRQFLLALIIAVFLAGIYYFLTAYTLHAQIEKNQQYTLLNFITGLGWTFRSVLFEELLFRGVLFYLLIRYIGSRWAIILSSVVFGVWHWFSYDILGEPKQMISVFLLTFTAGAVFAYAFVVTGSMYLQTAFHFGWNLVSINIISQGPLGDQLLKVSVTDAAEGWQSLIFFLYQLILVPGIMFLTIRILRKRDSIRGITISEIDKTEVPGARQAE